MLLSVDDKLGSYEILAPIGAGAMGEVYRARDARLNRAVAVRISKDHFTDRFTRDARSIAMLSHPNICRVYDLGPDYIVTEYVEGQDLRGPRNLEVALPIINQLIDGIEAAHERNIVHGDLRPSNIKITAEGVVKILDFGLAHAMSLPSFDGKSENSPTLIAATTPAVVNPAGAAYMAPEQARGMAADKRSDIWSFGVVLYELLTGKRLFPGETSREILTAVLRAAPDISAAPQRAHRLLSWCLEPDRKQRLASISEARQLLADRSVPAPVAVKSRRIKKPVIWGLGLAVVSAAIFGLLHRSTEAPRTATRLTIPLSQGQEITDYPAISPDGRTVAYIRRQGVEEPQLYLRDLNVQNSNFGDAHSVPGTAGAKQPFFSPDGKWIAFFAKGQLQKAPVAGGAPVRLADAASSYGGTWNEDNTIIYASSFGSGLLRIPADGGTPAALTKPDGGALGYGNLFPQSLPGGSVLFTTWGQTPADAVLSLETRHSEVVLPGRMASGAFARTSGTDGYLLLAEDAGVHAAPLDSKHPTRTGGVSAGLPAVYYDEINQRAWLAVSDSGTLAYAPGSPGKRSLFWIDRQGKYESLGKGQDAYAQVAISPDGSKAAIRDGFDLSIHDLLRGTRSRLTSGTAINMQPVWSADGTRVIFASNRTGDWDLYSQPADASQPAQALLTRPDDQFPLSVAADGTVLFAEVHADTGYDLWTLSPDGKAEPLRATPTNERDGQFEPRKEGKPRWVAYSSDESGRSEIYVESYPGAAKRIQVTTAGGIQPRWSRDGSELFYITGDAVVAVSFHDGAVDAPHRLFDRLDLLVDGYGYDVAPDGKRFLAIERDAASVPRQLNVILNWTHELDKLVTGSDK